MPFAQLYLCLTVISTAALANPANRQDVQAKADDNSATKPTRQTDAPPDAHTISKATAAQSMAIAPAEAGQSDEAIRQAANDKAKALLQDTTGNGLAIIRGKLQALNILLAQGLEPTCSRWLLAGYDHPDFHAHDQDRKILADARNLFDAIESDLQRLSEVDAEAAQNLSKTRNHMGLYLSAVEALLLDQGDQADRKKRRAASGLSILMEERNRSVATSAALWYAALRTHEKDLTPARSVLSPPLSGTRGKMTPYDFLGRIHRCRLWNGDRFPAGALTLLMQMEEFCEDWFPNADRVEQARSAIGLARIQLLRKWRDALPANVGEREREFFDTKIASIVQQALGEGRTVFRLGAVFPDLIALADGRNNEED